MGTTPSQTNASAQALLAQAVVYGFDQTIKVYDEEIGRAHV